MARLPLPPLRRLLRQRLAPLAPPARLRLPALRRLLHRRTGRLRLPLPCRTLLAATSGSSCRECGAPGLTGPRPAAKSAGPRSWLPSSRLLRRLSLLPCRLA
eukprot:13943633-Alexandrium_andersonii.AAC.1